MNLETLMDYNADVSLQFQDGTLPGSSIHLGMHSSVLRGACEAGTDAASSGQQQMVIPMPGLTKDDWMIVAPFLYPVIPRAAISSWPQLEVLLKVASQLDIALVLHEADCYLATNAKSLVADQECLQDIWKWLQLADRAGLQQCIPLLAAQAAQVDRPGCAQLGKLQELSPQVLQQLTMVCASNPCRPVGSRCQKYCSTCSPAFSFGVAAQPPGPVAAAPPPAGIFPGNFGFGLPAGPAAPPPGGIFPANFGFGVPAEAAAPPAGGNPPGNFGFGVPAARVSSFTLSWVCDTCHKA